MFSGRGGGDGRKLKSALKQRTNSESADDKPSYPGILLVGGNPRSRLRSFSAQSWHGESRAKIAADMSATLYSKSSSMASLVGDGSKVKSISVQDFFSDYRSDRNSSRSGHPLVKSMNSTGGEAMNDVQGGAVGGAVGGATSSLDDRITLVVDNTRFVVDPGIFVLYPNTMLGRMFTCGRDYIHPNERGEYDVADCLSATVFRAILEYYHCGQIICPPTVSVHELREACDYLLIPFGASTIKCQNLRGLLHELSNEGAWHYFLSMLDMIIVPVMVRCSEKGERECRVVVLCDGDRVNWDVEYPPPEANEDSKTVYSTALFRFLKYFENRDVAKHVLEERGLKKVCIANDGYPTFLEKVRARPGEEPEVVYAYVQRPVIQMSWEHDEAKSRRVDFRSFIAKSGSSLAEAFADPGLDRPWSADPVLEMSPIRRAVPGCSGYAPGSPYVRPVINSEDSDSDHLPEDKEVGKEENEI